jgi:hypothetical protein
MNPQPDNAIKYAMPRTKRQDSISPFNPNAGTVDFKMKIVYAIHDSQSRTITNPLEPILDR